jgi:hypothetical protein
MNTLVDAPYKTVFRACMEGGKLVQSLGANHTLLSDSYSGSVSVILISLI